MPPIDPLQNDIGRWDLTLNPDGVYRVDGRVIPSADHPAFRVDDGEPVVGVHSGIDNAEGLGWAVLGAHIE